MRLKRRTTQSAVPESLPLRRKILTHSFMDFLQSIILGIVEGFTEFLPISSTAHLVIVSDLLKIAQTAFVKSFEIGIQFGAILAVIILYWKKFLIDREVMKRILVAFLPTAILGFGLYKIFKTILLDNMTVIAGAVLVGGVIIILFEKFKKEPADAIDDIQKMSYKTSFIIGIVQSIAIIPGVSRAAATILGGLSLGLKRKTIVEFSFLLAAPTMLVATGYDLLKTGANFSGDEFTLLATGFVVSFLVAIVAIKFLLRYIQKNNFIIFGIYRIALGLVLFAFFLK